MRNAYNAQAPKKATNLSLNSELLAEAKRLNINLSATMEKALVQEVHEKKKAGYMITSLSSSNSNWMVVMSQNTDYNAQEICSAPWATQREWIKIWWNNDYYITSVTCRNGMWTVVMSKTSLYTDQTYMFSSTVDGIKEKIKIKRK